ncbi:MAG TPA: PilN domain-containing protein [Candidatus Acidoferrales bacterium]|nr:PilN domain-containing protein [Candidatus Acidoferrales bacterium]
MMQATRWMQNLSKVDFVTSVGIYILHDRIVLVRLRKNFRRVSLLEQEARELPEIDDRQGISGLTGWIAEDVREIALKTENDSRERGLRQALLSLMQHCNVGRDSFFICVPQDQAMVQKIFLPRAAEANLQEVLQYEIERYLPFRREDVYYDYMTAGREGEKIAVFLFAIPKKSLSNLLEILASFGIKPRGVETTATALANYLLFCAEETSDLATVIGAQDHSLEVVGLQNKTNGWKSVPELTYSYWLREADWAQSPGKDLLQQCFSQSAKLYGWGGVEEVFRSSDGTPLPYEDLVEKGKRRFKNGAKISNPLALPAFGAALRGVREAAFAGNVFSADAKDTQRRGALSYVNAALIGLVTLAAIAWGATYPIKDELRLRQLQKENQKLEPAVEALRREEDQLERARKEENFFSQFDQKKGEVLRVLDELSKIVPMNAYLSNLRYKAGAVEMQGSAENASALIPLLERSPVFENVGFNAPSNRGRDNRDTFSLKADVERIKEQPVKAAKP